MLINKSNIDRNFNTIPVSRSWNRKVAKSREMKMHKIHGYPAKFPSFVVSKAIDLAESEGVTVNTIADVFCGCGTTALEAKRNKIDFWGCDISPVATLIARVKSEQYSSVRLQKYFEKLSATFLNSKLQPQNTLLKNERINYWFADSQVVKLNQLLNAIYCSVPNGKYRNFFLVAFSNILKKCSRWLTKSIKPQVDPTKVPSDVAKAFETQFEFMLKANEQSLTTYSSKSSTRIKTLNFLKTTASAPFADLVITSPPYVTSYEYADLHQLSTIWLGYASDYRSLRSGYIGSLFRNSVSEEKINQLPNTGKYIYAKLKSVEKRKASSVGKYFIDIQQAIKKAYSITNSNGIGMFVIGNTRYKGVEIDNAKFLTECMIEENFKEINVLKRKISSKILTPYRDKKGRFSSTSSKKKTYSHEFIVIGKK